MADGEGATIGVGVGSGAGCAAQRGCSAPGMGRAGLRWPPGFRHRPTDRVGGAVRHGDALRAGRNREVGGAGWKLVAGSTDRCNRFAEHPSGRLEAKPGHAGPGRLRCNSHPSDADWPRILPGTTKATKLRDCWGAWPGGGLLPFLSGIDLFRRCRRDLPGATPPLCPNNGQRVPAQCWRGFRGLCQGFSTDQPTERGHNPIGRRGACGGGGRAGAEVRGRPTQCDGISCARNA